MSKVVLEYPNGRRHEIDFETELRLKVGDAFELYGRRWRVMSLGSPRRAGGRRYLDTDATICRPITTSPLTHSKPASREAQDA